MNWLRAGSVDARQPWWASQGGEAALAHAPGTRGYGVRPPKSVSEVKTMDDGDDRIDAENVEIDARRVVVNTGWTLEMAKWNTIGTCAGALVGLASLLLSALALWIVLAR